MSLPSFVYRELKSQNMYIANHAYSIVDKPLEEGQKEIQDLLDHAAQERFVCAVEWHDPGDLGMSPVQSTKSSL
jgi:hypothetical protein